MTDEDRDQFANDPKIGEVRGPDADGNVWLYSTHGAPVVMLGPKDDVVELFSQWLASIDADEAIGRRDRGGSTTVAVFDPR